MINGAATRSSTRLGTTSDAALLTVYWTNWCGRRPGPLRLRITLPGSGGVLVVPFNGPPGYSYVPGCVSPGRASTIAVVSAHSVVAAGRHHRCPQF
jgi:hypothetical protein